MSKRKNENSSGGIGLALAGLVGVGLGALGAYVFSKINEDEKKPVQVA